MGADGHRARGATNGVTTLWLSGEVAAGGYASAWLLWWTGDAMGDLVIAPLILVLANTPLRELRRPHWQLEAGSPLVLLVAVTSRGSASSTEAARGSSRTPKVARRSAFSSRRHRR